MNQEEVAEITTVRAKEEEEEESSRKGRHVSANLRSQSEMERLRVRCLGRSQAQLVPCKSSLMSKSQQ